MSKILGLDPGSRFTGWGVIAAAGSRLRPVAHGRIDLRGKEPLAARLARLVRGLEGVLERFAPSAVALEALYHGVNPRSLIVLAEARGALLAALGATGLEIHEYAPAEIKAAVTGSGRADKQQVSRMVCLELGLGRIEIPTDATDALAAAICYARRRTLDRLRGRVGPQAEHR